MQHERTNGVKGYPAPVSEAGLPSPEFRQTVPDFEDSVDLRDYLEVILRRKWLILTFLVGVFVTTLIVSLSMQPVFKATGGLELSPQEAKVTKFEDVIATQLQTREFMQTQVKLLQSVSLARRVVEKLNLEKHPLFNPESNQEEPGLFQKLKESVSSTLKGWMEAIKPQGDDAAGVRRQNEAFEKLRKQKDMESWFADNLEVKPERDTTLVTLSFSSTDPALARDAINTLIREFISWEMDKRIDSASSAKQQLEKQIEVARIQLEKSESRMNRFAQKAGIVSLDSKLNLIYRQLEEINRALAEAQAERIAKQALYEKAIKSDASSLSQVIENELIQRLREQYVQFMAQYQEMSSTFKDGYPKMKNLKAKIRDIRQKIAAEEERILNSIITDYQVALRREKALQQEAQEKKERALELNNRATQYKILEREVETNKQIYESLLGRAKEIDANVGTDLSNIRVVDYADLPLTPYKPNVRLNLLLALVVGLMGGIGIAFFLEYLDNTVKGLDEISDRFQIPVLGVVPRVDPEEVKTLDTLVCSNPRSGFAEAIRTFKVSVQLCSFMDRAPKTLLFTGTAQGEGKTTLAANLAQAFATSEEKVILIEADLRKPRLQKVFSANGVKGLSHLLSGLCKLDEAVCKTEVPNLYFISAGPIPPNPVELLASNRMRKVLEKLSQHFDRIILDGPPAVGFADVLALSNIVDGVILVSLLGETHREALRICRRSLANVGGHLLGTVVNKLNLNKQYGGYYYKYYKYYTSYYQPYGEKPEEDRESLEKPPEA